MTEHQDGCASSSEIRKQAYFWTVAMLVVAYLLVWNLSRLDRMLFDGVFPFINPQVHRENRAAATGIPSESIDERARQVDLGIHRQ